VAPDAEPLIRMTLADLAKIDREMRTENGCLGGEKLGVEALAFGRAEK
jgi:hypothetical protein